MVGTDILGQAIRCFILDSQSITTIMFIQPLLLGRLIIKLIKMFFHLRSGTGRGFRKPLYILYKALAYQQVWQLETYLLYYIMHIQLVVFLLEQFQGFSLAWMAGYQQVICMFKELKLKFVMVRYNQAVSVVQVVSVGFIFTQRNPFRASSAILNQLKRLLDKLVVWVFISYNLFNGLIGYFKNIYYEVLSRGFKQLRVEQGLIVVGACFFLSWCVL